MQVRGEAALFSTVNATVAVNVLPAGQSHGSLRTCAVPLMRTSLAVH